MVELEVIRMDLSMIELLYDSIQEQPEIFIPKDRQFEIEMSKLCEIEMLAKEQLTEEQLAIFKQFDQVQSEVQGITNRMQYKNGFISGFLLYAEIFSGRYCHDNNE